MLLGDGFGNFGSAHSFNVGWYANSVTAADIDLDGRPDLVVPNYLSHNVSILLNRCCPYGISKTGDFFGVNGGQGFVSLTTLSNCAWTATSNDTWILITSAEQGGGSDDITYEVRENFTNSARSGSIVIAGLTLTVIQDGGLGSDCDFSISPGFQVSPVGGGTGSISVFASERCAWQAVSNVGWVGIQSGQLGIGNGTVTYTVAKNQGASGRKGTITIAGVPFTIKQKGN